MSRVFFGLGIALLVLSALVYWSMTDTPSNQVAAFVGPLLLAAIALLLAAIYLKVPSSIDAHLQRIREHLTGEDLSRPEYDEADMTRNTLTIDDTDRRQ